MNKVITLIKAKFFNNSQITPIDDLLSEKINGSNDRRIVRSKTIRVDEYFNRI